MLNKDQLKSDLKDIFDDVSGKTTAEKSQEIGNAIKDYLAGASVGMPPAGTASSVQFPAAAALPVMIQVPPPGATSAPFIATISSAVASATATSIGKMDGAPIPPGTSIVSEIGLPPIVPAASLLTTAFTSNDQTSDEAANNIATAIHTSVTSILFTVTVLVPTPAGPVPTPIPGIPIK